MRISRSFEYPADPHAVAAMVADPAFQARKCEATHAESHTESVTPLGDSTQIRTRRVMPTDDFPDFVRSMVGPKIAVSETYVWSAPAADGSRDGTVEVEVGDGKVPVAMTGTMTLRPGGPGSVVRIEGELKAKVPLIGGRIEKAAEPAVLDAIAKEREVGLEWLGAS
ncbi:DUF2505 domain-containing protein [Lapillicoccus jejuensis]|uniref:Uncharacterized protein DUF2505 n=1 Tax=Lapillicoccus jejuensis TaxID=402171 RepID=A0A542E2L8_9MICO|nr:DUF2505 domain-containing protein [Lapillicoccus jejuensis]TQJ09583.1 uncharacterized protein DUF2505 [Lapillicoccus jejuensis]